MTDADRVIRILEGGYKKNVLRNNGELVTVTEIIALLQSRQREIDSLRADLEAETRENLRLAEMVKPMEARVMTLEEVKSCENAMWVDTCNGRGFYAFVLDRMKNGILEVSTRAAYLRLFSGNYGVNWRCWTSRPTDEQREAVKWE